MFFLLFNFIQSRSLPFPILGQLLSDPLVALSWVIGIIVGITVHEFSHALVAYRLGDPTAKLQGRLTLNPLSHLDPVGTIAILLIGFGWGKPTPFDPYNLRNVKRDSALISVAGAVSNFVLAIALAIPYLFVFYTHTLTPGVNLAYVYISRIIFINLALGVFNLIPIAPLDGFKVLAGLLPKNWYEDFIQTEPYGIFLLLALLLTGTIAKILLPIVSVILGVLIPSFQTSF